MTLRYLHVWRLIKKNNIIIIITISNLHTIPKIDERLFMTRLIQHVHQSPNYSKCQSAYRKHYSSEMALLRMLNEVSSAADKGTRIGADWIASYLVCRKQTVCVGSSQSSTTERTHGLPRGTVFGPLLFTIYMSPISQLASSYSVNLVQYADHRQLYVSLNKPNSTSRLSGVRQNARRQYARIP